MRGGSSGSASEDDQIGNGDLLVPGRERGKVALSEIGGIVVDDGADRCGKTQARKLRQMDRCLGVGRPRQHPTLTSTDGQDMSRAREAVRDCFRFDHEPDRRRPIRGKMPVVTPNAAIADTVNAFCVRLSLCWKISGESNQPQSWPGSGTHTTPDAYRTRNAIFCWVTSWPAKTR